MKITKVETIRVKLSEEGRWIPANAYVRIETEDGLYGLGEASPMGKGLLSLSVIEKEFAPYLIGQDALDHAVLLDGLGTRLAKLGEGIATAALAALDIAFWDLKGKYFNQPIHKLIGGAWRTELPFYSSIGGNAHRTVDEVVRHVAERVERENPAAVKIRWDGDRTRQDFDIKGDIAKAKAVRKLLGDDFVIGFDANNGFSVGGAMHVGRALEDLGYSWFEEPLQHYHVQGLGELASRLSISVSAGEQTYTLQGLKSLIDAGVRMIQPDPIKMGGITGMMQASALAFAHGVEFVPHQTQPGVGAHANLHIMSSVMHMTHPVELADMWERGSVVFNKLATPVDGKFKLPEGPGLGIELNEAEWSSRQIAA